MKIIGITAEYNPFHSGHEYHVEQTRSAFGGDCAIISVMSGNFVQRGDAAVFSKHLRARAAVECGCDLVFELPVPWALSSAEGFARGAVGIFSSLGGVDAVSFGSESADIGALREIAAYLVTQDFSDEIKREMKSGIPFASARQCVLERASVNAAELIARPNDLLAVEYIKAGMRLCPGIEMFAVKRSGAGHDEDSEGAFRSASNLRRLLAAGESISGFVPKRAAEIYSSAAIVSTERLDDAILSRLRLLDKAGFEDLPDSSEGLSARLYRAVSDGGSFDEIAGNAKTKRYAMSRIRRMLMCAVLGVKKGMAMQTPKYARVLAANARGRAALKELSETTSIPIITKPASAKSLPADVRKSFELDCAASDFYALGYSSVSMRRAGSDWRTSPAMV